MYILAIDTTSESCSLALSIGQGEPVTSRCSIVPREHGERILPMLESLLAECGCQRSQLDAIAYAAGPGSFTGVRLSTGIAQGLAYGLGLPVIAVSTLRVLAQGAWRLRNIPHILPALDARMGELYWGQYEWSKAAGIVLPCRDDALSAPSEIELPDEGEWLALGRGWDVYGEQLKTSLKEQCLIKIEQGIYPEALDILPIACKVYEQQAWLSPERAQPVYLRNQVAKKSEALPNKD